MLPLLLLVEELLVRDIGKLLLIPAHNMGVVGVGVEGVLSTEDVLLLIATGVEVVVVTTLLGTMAMTVEVAVTSLRELQLLLAIVERGLGKSAAWISLDSERAVSSCDITVELLSSSIVFDVPVLSPSWQFWRF